MDFDTADNASGASTPIRTGARLRPRSSQADHGVTSGFQFKRAAALWRFWLALAWADWRTRYRRSALGAAWVFVSFAAFVGVKVLVFGAMSAQDLGFFAIWLAAGFLVWTYISANIVEGCNVFVASSRWIKGADLPYIGYVLQSVMRNNIQLFLSALVLVIALLAVPPASGLASLTILLAIPVLMVNALWAQLALGVLCARYRDFIHLSQTVVRLLFFLTPILWVPADFGRFGDYAVYNPFTHYLAIVRDPLVFGTVPGLSWLIVLAITGCGVLASLIAFHRFRHKIVFWV